MLTCNFTGTLQTSCPDLVHGPAAIHQHTHRLSVLKGLLQTLQLLLSRRQTVLLKGKRQLLRNLKAFKAVDVSYRRREESNPTEHELYLSV